MTKPNTPSNVRVSDFDEDQINLKWNKGTGAHYTIIERNTTGISSWNLGEGTQIYNGTGNQCEDTDLSTNTHYYYQLWSFTSAEGKQQYSSTYATVNWTPQKYYLLLDSEFKESTDSIDLRNNNTDQDWYESRNSNPNLLTLDTSNVVGINSGNKAALKGQYNSTTAYLTQELFTPQTDSFNVSLDIYIHLKQIHSMSPLTSTSTE
jgi:hypothetical protein